MTLARTILFLSLLSVHAVGAESGGNSCSSWSELIREDKQETIDAHLNSKRPYPEDKPTIRPPEGCSVVHTTYIGRHGSRYVTKPKTLIKIENKLHELLGGSHDDSDLTATGLSLRKLVQEITQSVEETQAAGNITSRGKQELELIARRLATGVRLAPAQIEPEGAITAMTTSKKRTEQSLDAFMGGLKQWSINPLLSYTLNKESEDSDQLLRSYEFCPNRKLAYEQSKIHLETARQKLIEESRLSFKAVQALTNKTLDRKERIAVAEQLYQLCQIDSSYPNAEQYGFCRYLLDENDDVSNEARFIGMLNNHKEWFKRGFGSGETVMYNLASPLLNKVADELSRVNSSEHHPMLNLWFSHDSTIVPLIMLAGYYADNPTYPDWDNDLASPMSANIQWRVYRCNGEYKLQMLLNEQSVCNSDCPEAFCSLSDYIDNVRKKLSEVQYSEECGIDED